jgi:hypothetical protein
MGQDHDRARDISIYRFLLRQALVPDASGEPNFRQTAKRFGKTAADFAIRIHREIHGQEQKFGPAKLTTGKLVELIEGLQKGLAEAGEQTGELFLVSRQLTDEEILRMFQYLIRLAPEEIERLGLDSFEEDSLLQQALLNIGIYNRPANRDAIWDLYLKSVGLGLDRSLNEENCLDSSGMDAFIEKNVTEILQRYGLSGEVEKYKNSVKKVIDRIQYQIGLDKEDEIKRWFIEKNLTGDIVRQIALSVVENKLLNREYPIYIKAIEIERMKPFPLKTVEYPDRDPYGVINKAHLQNRQENDFQHTRFQHCYRVSIIFRAKVPDRTGKISEIRFRVSSTGVGGKLSQIARVIDRTLLWDVKCLRNHFFPMFSDLVTVHNLQRNDSPVFAHSLVKFCRLDSIERAFLKKCDPRHKERKLDEIYRLESYLDEVARGDYCGFDFIETSAKSSLQARLRAIKNTGEVDATEYLQDLRDTIARKQTLKRAEKRIRFYPFSLSAMETDLKRNLLQEEIREKPLIHYDAELLIIHSYLVEGLYSKAHVYLKKLYDDLELLSRQSIALYRAIDNPSNSSIECQFQGEENERFKIFSGSLLAKYELYKGLYYLVYDIEDDRAGDFRLEEEVADRQQCLARTLECCRNAEIHIKLRSAKYQTINEIAKNYFHPYFQILAQIYHCKAKLHFFFPDRLPLDNGNDSAFECCRFWEEGRLYAAKDGDTNLYSYITAWKAWVYVIESYRSDSDRDHQLKWAKKLLYHSLMAYAETGNECYDQIKEKSGVENALDIDSYRIDSIPPIIEYNLRDLNVENRRSAEWDKYQSLGFFDGTLRLDMSLLHIKNINAMLIEDRGEDNDFFSQIDNTNDYNQQVYLFGTKACILLFSIGVYEFCSALSESIFLKASGFNEYSARVKWCNKIFRAYRVFSYAFAIAEDGGRITGRTDPDGCERFEVERPDFQSNRHHSTDYHSPDVDSIRDLYPHRVTEIVDLGKIYAAACDLLLCSLTDDPRGRREFQSDAARLFSKLGDISRSYPELVEGQSRFNGHLREYLEKTRRWIVAELETAPIISDPDAIRDRRDEIARNLFNAFRSSES